MQGVDLFLLCIVLFLPRRMHGIILSRVLDHLAASAAALGLGGRAAGHAVAGLARPHARRGGGTVGARARRPHDPAS
jgi:hypothetical protein